MIDEGAEAFRLCTTIAFLCVPKCFLTCFEDIPNLCFRTRFKFAHLLLLVFPCFPRFAFTFFYCFLWLKGEGLHFMCVAVNVACFLALHSGRWLQEKREKL